MTGYTINTVFSYYPSDAAKKGSLETKKDCLKRERFITFCLTFQARVRLLEPCL